MPPNPLAGGLPAEKQVMLHLPVTRFRQKVDMLRCNYVHLFFLSFSVIVSL